MPKRWFHVALGIVGLLVLSQWAPHLALGLAAILALGIVLSLVQANGGLPDLAGQLGFA